MRGVCREKSFIIYKSFRKIKVESKWAIQKFCSIFSKLSLTSVFSFVDVSSFVYPIQLGDL